MLKISIKFGVALQSFCETQNSVQNQDQDQDHDITLDFNTRPTFHTWKTLTKGHSRVSVLKVPPNQMKLCMNHIKILDKK